MSQATDVDRKLLIAVERLGRALRAGRQQAATRHGLSLLGLKMLEVLADDRARRVGDVAAELDISQPTASDALATLQRRDLVQRRRDRDDLRITLVTLSPAGKELTATIAGELAPMLVAKAGSSDELGVTLRVLLGEISRLQAAGVITVNRSCLTCDHYQPPRAQPPQVRTSAHCLLLGTALADHDLRVDCNEHKPA